MTSASTETTLVSGLFRGCGRDSAPWASMVCPGRPCTLSACGQRLVARGARAPGEEPRPEALGRAGSAPGGLVPKGTPRCGCGAGPARRLQTPSQHRRLECRRTPGRVTRTRRARGWWGSPPFRASWIRCGGKRPWAQDRPNPKHAGDGLRPPALAKARGPEEAGSQKPHGAQSGPGSAPHGPLPGQATSLPQFPHVRQGDDTYFPVSVGADPLPLPEALHTHFTAGAKNGGVQAHSRGSSSRKLSWSLLDCVLVSARRPATVVLRDRRGAGTPRKKLRNKNAE